MLRTTDRRLLTAFNKFELPFNTRTLEKSRLKPSTPVRSSSLFRFLPSKNHRSSAAEPSSSTHQGVACTSGGARPPSLCPAPGAARERKIPPSARQVQGHDFPRQAIRLF